MRPEMTTNVLEQGDSSACSRCFGPAVMYIDDHSGRKWPACLDCLGRVALRLIQGSSRDA